MVRTTIYCCLKKESNIVFGPQQFRKPSRVELLIFSVVMNVEPEALPVCAFVYMYAYTYIFIKQLGLKF